MQNDLTRSIKLLIYMHFIWAGMIIFAMLHARLLPLQGLRPPLGMANRYILRISFGSPAAAQEAQPMATRE
jgi:hypothetical protein